MNLVIDIGNTMSKLAVFRGRDPYSFSSVEKISAGILEDFLGSNPGIKNAILSSVTFHDPSIIRMLESRFHFIELSESTSIPVKNLYRSPESLGKDRLACAVGAHLLFPNKNVLAIDAGTCIKYDFVNASGHYLGGGISPGIDLRFRSLNQFTDKLPLLTYRPFDELIGNTTEGSILSGVLNGVAEEVKGIVQRYREEYPGLRVVLTGGFMKFFERIFNIQDMENSSIFADSFLVLKGLNQILIFNENK